MATRGKKTRSRKAAAAAPKPAKVTVAEIEAELTRQGLPIPGDVAETRALARVGTGIVWRSVGTPGVPQEMVEKQAIANVVFAYEWTGGTLKLLGKAPTLPADFTAPSTSAEIAVHPSGKFVYSSNRGHDSIAVFKIRDDGTPEVVGHTPTGGKEPRNFAIDPTGKYLVATNQKSDNVLSFKIDPTNGTLTPTGSSITLDAPVCVRFLPPGGRN